MKIKLLDYKVVNLSLQTSEDAMTVEAAKNNLNLEVGQFYPDDKKQIFGVGFKVAPQPKAERRYKTLNISDIQCFYFIWLRQIAQNAPIQRESKRDSVEQA